MLRKGSLPYIRMTRHEMGTGPGVRDLERLCEYDGSLVNETIGVFHRLLQIAGAGSPDQRGHIRNGHDRPAEITDLATWFGYKRKDIPRLQQIMNMLTDPELGWLEHWDGSISHEVRENPGNSGKENKQLEKEKPPAPEPEREPWESQEVVFAQAFALRAPLAGRMSPDAREDTVVLVRLAKHLWERCESNKAWIDLLANIHTRMRELQRQHDEGKGGKPMEVLLEQMQEEYGFQSKHEKVLDKTAASSDIR